MPGTSRLRPAILAARERLAAGRAELAARHARGESGSNVARGIAELYDGVVADLYRAVLSDLGEDGPDRLAGQLALVAHGSYGLRILAPFSDADVMLLVGTAEASRVQAVARCFVRDLCDAGLELGHSVRTPEEASAFCLKDVAAWTSFLSARVLEGSKALFSRFWERYERDAKRHGRQQAQSAQKARDQERARYGETVYLLEPNVKRSRGGLRDIHFLRWVAFARHGHADFDRLVESGNLLAEDRQSLERAWEFLLRLRNEMHFTAGRSNDELDRALQVRIAAAFEFEGDAALLPVERFMREFFRHTHTVSRVAARFAAGADGPSRWANWLVPLVSQHYEGDFRISPGEIAVLPASMAKVTGSLEQVLRLADLANLYNKRIAPATAAAVTAAAPKWVGSPISPEAAGRFRSILQHPTRLGEVLRFLHDCRALESLAPEFEHARGLLQFNQYHKYTVDEHCLWAVERASQFATDPSPVGRTYREIKHKWLLHLALLLHDLGKGHADDHSQRGLAIAADCAKRLGLAEREAETLKFLVHKHLLMSHLAFRRDTSDSTALVPFAVEVGSPDVLKLLFVLTAADLAAVGPGVWNTWKQEVLTELFHRTMEHLAGESPETIHEDRLEGRRNEVRGLLGRAADEPWFQRQLLSLPLSYLQSFSAAQIAQDLTVLSSIKPGEVKAEGKYRTEQKTLTFTVATREDVIPGIFHRLTGALTSKDLAIHSAEIVTLAEGYVIDRFTVSDSHQPGPPPPDRIESIQESMIQALVDPSISFRPVQKWARKDEDLSRPPTQVRIDNDSSGRFTIMDVFAKDRAGLLFTISRELFELGLSVGVAKIATHLDQVVDVFYVTDQDGRKIDDQTRLDAVRESLLATIEEFWSRR
jgi:[protein-PII] uridylyltransferase